MDIFSWFRTKKKFKGEDIREVWDYRLSKGCPYLYCDAPYWIIRIWPNAVNRREPKKALIEYVTDIPATGNPHDRRAIILCYNWLYKVRDDYAKNNMNALKPAAAKIYDINQKAIEAARMKK